MLATSAPRWLNRFVLRRAAAICLVTLLGCEVAEGIPEGKLAVVGPTVLGPEDVAAARSQVGAYGQLRFGGAEGEATMLEALIAVELIALEAEANGFGDDPRVDFAVEEEIATVYLTTLLERAVPREQVASDTEALRAYYDAHLADFTEPESRSAQGVVFKTFAEAEAALSGLVAGTTTLDELGDVVATPLQARDDAEYPGFHPFLYGEGVAEGDFLPHPVFVGESLLVGRVQKVEPAAARPFEDAAVQEQLVAAVIEPLREAAKAEILERLRRGEPPL